MLFRLIAMAKSIRFGTKIFRCRKENTVLVLFALIMCIATAVFCRQAVEVNSRIEDNKVFYRKLIEKYGGKYSETKDRKLLNEEKTADIEERYKQSMLLKQYYGAADEDDVYEATKNMLYDRNSISSLAYVRQQMEYAKKDVAKREIIYQNGWIELFNRNYLFYVPVLWSVLLTSVFFSIDYGNGMYTLSGTFEYGGRHIYFARVSNSLLVGCGLYVVTVMVRLITVYTRYGLGSRNVHLQSVTLFQDSTLSVNLLSAYLISVFIGITGMFFINAFTVLVCTLLKNAIKVFVTVIISVATTTVIPGKGVYYTGWGMIRPMNYIAGIKGKMNDELKYMSQEEVTVAIIIALTSTVILYYVGSVLYEKNY